MKFFCWHCFITVLMVGLALSIHVTQDRLDDMNLRLTSMDVYMYIPSGEFLKPFTLGYRQIVADFFWIKAISYFGGELKSGGHYLWLYHILDLVTTLDPQFTWPYYFGGMILSLEAKQVENSNAILKKAMRYHPDVWKFPFYLGFNYWYHYDDPVTAASYIEIAARLPGAPAYLRTFPATLYSRGGRLETAITFLEEMENTAQDPHVKDQIRKKIAKLMSTARKSSPTGRKQSPIPNNIRP